MIIVLSDLQTLAVALAALVATGAFARRISALRHIPLPVVAGLLVALVVHAFFRYGGADVQFAPALRDFFLLVFFATLGLAAKFSALKAGGRPLLIVCAVTILLLVAQNVVGIGVALINGAHPYYGLLIGSVSYVGGPGTAAAWAREAAAAGLVHAPEIAVGAATLAVVVGALVSGPITVFLIRRHRLAGPVGDTPASWIAPRADGEQSAPAPPIAVIMQMLLLIVAAVVVGTLANDWARRSDVVLPGFLTAMLAGVAITNAADLFGVELDFAPIERGGEIALQCFLVMYLMSLKLWTLGAAVGPLMLNVAVQIAVTAAIAIFVLFRLLGRDYDAAVAVGGFLGFGLSSMPVAVSTMDGIASRYGPSPKAFLIISLAGSFFVDLANALVVKGFLAFPLFR